MSTAAYTKQSTSVMMRILDSLSSRVTGSPSSWSQYGLNFWLRRWNPEVWCHANENFRKVFLTVVYFMCVFKKMAVIFVNDDILKLLFSRFGSALSFTITSDQEITAIALLTLNQTTFFRFGSALLISQSWQLLTNKSQQTLLASSRLLSVILDCKSFKSSFPWWEIIRTTF